MPHLTLSSSDGNTVDLSALPHGRTVIYRYPLTGRPGVDLPAGLDSIPGARGCFTEACNFRDHHQELRDAGAADIYGMSSQWVQYQAEVVERLHLPFRMLSDPTWPSPTPSTSRHSQRPAITACTHAARSSSPTEQSSPCDRRRDSDLRLQPNRPGTSVTERRLEINDLWESRKSVVIAALKRALCDILCGCPASGRGIASPAKLSSP